MKNSIYREQDNTIAFYDGRAFKSLDELTTYLLVSCNHTEAACRRIVSTLPTCSREEAKEFLNVAKLATPRRGATIAKMMSLEDDTPKKKTSSRKKSSTTTRKRATRKTTNKSKNKE